MKTSSSVFRSLITLCGAALGTLAHSLGLSMLRQNPSPASKFWVGQTPHIPAPNRQAFAGNHGSVLTNLASGQLRHRATVMFTKLTTALRSESETGLALT